METSQYKELFISEAQEILRNLDGALVSLERKPSDKECLNTIFRHAHTLKGMAATMGFERIVKLTHAMEGVLGKIREGSLKIEKEIIDQLFKAHDFLETLLRSVEKGEEKGVGEEAVIEELRKVHGSRFTVNREPLTDNRVLRMEDSDRKHILKEMKKGKKVYQAMISFKKECSMPEARAIIILNALKKEGEIVGENYILNQIRSKQFGRHFGFFFLTDKEATAVSRLIEEIPDVEKVALTPLTADSVQSPDNPQPSTDIPAVRVRLDRLESLMNVVGELVINKIRLVELGQQIGHKPLLETITQMNRLTSSLQAEMMQIRLLPLEYIFNHFPRMVRDLASQEKKEVDLVIQGADIGVDRSVLDEINDPLIHILRNSLTHGIEPPGEREKKGKPPRGRIKVEARREKNFVVIEVSDDGKGMDPQAIRKEVLAKGILPKEELNRLSDSEILNLITLPGFSLSETTSELAGRGVGMNVVKNKVEAIGGVLNIQSGVGEGSLFRLKLPLTMAIIQAMLVGLREETYAIPLVNIAETIKIKKEMIKTMEHQEMIPYRDKVLPLVRLGERLGFNGSRESLTHDSRPTTHDLSVVVVEIGFKKAGLIVDRLLGQQEVVIKSLTGNLKGMRGLSGATILGSGKVAMILDVGALI